MLDQVLMAGFGGQGVLTCGRILALAAMAEGKHVTWVPSYGPEQRGGTANCVVTISDRPIGSPLLEEASAALIFNQPSLTKFGSLVQPGGILVVNSSLVRQPVNRTGLAVYPVPADDMAREIEAPRAVNLILLAFYVALSHAVSEAALMEANHKHFGKAKQPVMDANLRALAAGRDYFLQQK